MMERKHNRRNLSIYKFCETDKATALSFEFSIITAWFIVEEYRC